MWLKTVLLLSLGFVLSTLKQVGCRSLGDTESINFPDQAGYQEYAGEQSEYVEQPGEAERQVRNVQDSAVEKYQQKEVARDERNIVAEDANNVGDAGYQPRINGDEDELERSQGNEVVVDRRVVDMRDVKKEDEGTDSVERRDEESLRQNNPDQGDVDSAAFRKPRENNQEVDNILPDEAMTEGQGDGDMAAADPADANYEAVNEPISGQKENAPYTGADNGGNNYNYVQEPENAEAVEGGPQNVMARNEEAAPQAQYEQENN